MNSGPVYGYMINGEFIPFDNDMYNGKKPFEINKSDIVNAYSIEGMIDDVNLTQNFWEQTLLCGDKDLKTAINSSKATSQTEALIRMIRGENVFLSGSAGSGKTYVLNRFNDIMNALYDLQDDELVFTGTTGMASTLLPDGRTIHSWCGLGIETHKFPEELLIAHSLEDFNKKGYHIDGYDSRININAFERIKKCKILVIDEISMMPACFFKTLDTELRWVHGNTKPFGGIQLIVCGDFAQLQPVPDGVYSRIGYDYGFCFRTEAWKECHFSMLFMDRAKRAVDEELNNILEIIRKGEKDRFNEVYQTINKTKFKNTRGWTKLFAVNRQVDSWNKTCQSRNNNYLYTFRPIEDGDEAHLGRIRKSLGIEKDEPQKFKINDIVMITVNLGSCVNGDKGRILKIENDTYTIMLDDREIVNIGPHKVEDYRYEWIEDKIKKTVTKIKVPIASVTCIPLKLAYAISIHKSQGQTFSHICCDLGNAFIESLGYVAFSRARTLEDLAVDRYNKITLEIRPEAIEFNNNLYNDAIEQSKNFYEKAETFFSQSPKDIERRDLLMRKCVENIGEQS